MGINILMDTIDGMGTVVNVISISMVIIYTIKEYNLHLILSGIFNNDLRFSFDRVEKSVKKIDKKIKKSQFSPKIIVGVGGGKYVGGPIIASLLASRKYQHIDCIYLELPRDSKGGVDWKEGDKIVNAALPKIKSHLSEVGTDILLVDDISKTGCTISKTKEKLENNLDDISPTIEVAVIVVTNESLEKLGDNFCEKEFYCNYSEKKETKFPWEI